MKILASNFRNKRFAFEHLTALRKGTGGFMMVCTAGITIARLAPVTGKHDLHVIGVYRLSLGDQDQPFHNIAQLSDISRPAILPQLFNRFIIERFLLPNVLGSNSARAMRESF